MRRPSRTGGVALRLSCGNGNAVPDLVTAVRITAEGGPDQCVAVWRDPVHDAFVDNALRCPLSVDRVAIDEPHGHRLAQPVGSLRIRIDVLSVELEPELARVVGEDVLVVDLRRRPVQKYFLLDAAVLRRVNQRAGVLEPILKLQGWIRPVEVDAPRADDRQFRRIDLFAGDTITAEESYWRRLR